MHTLTDTCPPGGLQGFTEVLQMSAHHVYGPVPSRRLGRSLGVDIIPFKTCTYDCTYCQLGHTTCHTMERREYVPAEVVEAELAAHLERDLPDIISFAGSGEPTLNTSLGRLIARIKQMTDVPVAVFTNASLLWMPEVRRDLAQADIVSPSLDAVSAACAKAVNTPVAGLDIEVIIEGLRTFCAEYTGQIWIEVLLVRGINDSPEELGRLRSVLTSLPRYDRIQLNTATRPPADSCVQALSREELDAAAKVLDLPCEIIASWHRNSEQGSHDASCTATDVLELVRCHPSTAQDVASGLAISEARARHLVAELLAAGHIQAEDRAGNTWYIVREQQ